MQENQQAIAVIDQAVPAAFAEELPVQKFDPLSVTPHVESETPFIDFSGERGGVALHDALSDLVVPPLGRANHLQGMMAGISLQQHRYKMIDGFYNNAKHEEMVAYLRRLYPFADVNINYVTINTDHRVMYAIVQKVIKKNQVNFHTGAQADERRFYAMAFGGRDAGFIALALPEQASMEKLGPYFETFIPEREFVINLFDPGGNCNGIKIKRKNTVVYDEFYPYLGMPVKDFIEGFYESNSNVITLTGPAGCGKSSLMKHFLNYNQDSYYLVDSNAVYEDPKVFAALMDMVRKESQKNRVTLFLEEADRIVQSKRDDQTGALTSLLSMGSGVLDLDVKIVITSNLDNNSKLDVNLIRNGRTYCPVECRLLTPDEANIARARLGKPPVDHKKSVTLSDALNCDNMAAAMNRRRMQTGFVSAAAANR